VNDDGCGTEYLPLHMKKDERNKKKKIARTERSANMRTTKLKAKIRSSTNEYPPPNVSR
jgi:hypothetical protein